MRAILTCLATATLAAAMAGEAPPAKTDAPRIEVAILLDTSSSMDGLINQARSRLWAIVNDLAKTTKDGKTPDIRVALYEYGNDRLTARDGWIRRVQPLTDDLDAISDSLFKLTTNGGQEYCGQVIRQAVDELGWSTGDHYRAIFIAGNEPFTQGSVKYADACKAAVAKGIVVNTIHCGSADQGRQGEWDQGARLADGQSLNIDQNQTEVAIAAPQDAKIAELNLKLNTTYLAFGAEGGARRERQMAQETNAASVAPAAVVERAAAKSGAAYRNASWDLVDAAKDKSVKLDEIPAEQLPAEMKELKPEERAAFVAKKAEERGQIQAEIVKLVKERETFVAEERKKQAAAAPAADSFGAAASKALDVQLKAKGFEQKP